MRLDPIALLVLIPLASACGGETTDPLARSPADAAPADISVDQPAAADSPAGNSSDPCRGGLTELQVRSTSAVLWTIRSHRFASS